MVFDDLKKPILFQDVEFKFEDDLYFLYHLSENKILQLENSVAINIVNLINGENSIKDIITNVQVGYSEISPTIIKNDTVEFLKYLNDENFIAFFE